MRSVKFGVRPFLLGLAIGFLGPLGGWLYVRYGPGHDFVSQARDAYSQGDEERGAAFLSAALIRQSDDPFALDLYSERLHGRFQSALTNLDWDQGQVQIAG